MIGLAKSVGGMSKKATVVSQILTYNTRVTTLSGQNWTGVNFGTAATGRVIVVGIGGITGAGVPNIAGVTLGGVTATMQARIQSPSTSNGIEIWTATVNTGTTGDITLSWSSQVNYRVVGVWSVYSANPTPYATNTSSGDSGSGDPSATISVPAGGCIIGALTAQTSGSISWTNLTEKYQDKLDASSTYTGASDIFSTTQTNRTISATVNGGPSAFALISFQP
jgi:hypothetical protein